MRVGKGWSIRNIKDKRHVPYGEWVEKTEKEETRVEFTVEESYRMGLTG